MEAEAPPCARYARQEALAEVGAAGQLRVRGARVLVVGAGGLGSAALLYLAGAGLGALGVCDADTVAVHNLHRQVIHSTDRAGRNKAESAQQTLALLNPDVKIVAYPFRVTGENVMSLVANYDVVVDATDNVAARYLLSDACVLSGGLPLVSAAALRFDGQLSVYCAGNAPCYRCVNPSPPPPAAIRTCVQAGVFGPVPGVLGAMEAVEALKVVAGIGDTLTGRLLIYDGLRGTSRVVKLRGRQPQCPVCGTHPTITAPLRDYAAFCATAKQQDGTK
eukprot:TRINITY_DN1730_c0_g1_i10.p2 TRINITY_DN1730_c0_g1~~TRINITY_DN1730_c0_g1_i10.p2  ORF type:complete len:277 (+),score=63.85 TRINITY_DN1730_c0_g1_i10:571-1401(+)